MMRINGFNFDNKNDRKRMKYIVVYDGDLDLNGCRGFSNKKDLNEFIKEGFKKIQAVFLVKEKA